MYSLKITLPLPACGGKSAVASNLSKNFRHLLPPFFRECKGKRPTLSTKFILKFFRFFNPINQESIIRTSHFFKRTAKIQRPGKLTKFFLCFYSHSAPDPCLAINSSFQKAAAKIQCNSLIPNKFAPQPFEGLLKPFPVAGLQG